MCLAVPGRIRRIGEVNGTSVAEVEFGGVVRLVTLALVPDAAVGDAVVVHSGIAVRRLDPDAAAATLATLAAAAPD